MIDFNPIMNENCNPDDALQPPVIYMHPRGECMNSARLWQGVPSIEHTPKGRVWFAFYSGRDDEGIGNYVVLFKTDDEGKTMEEPFLSVTPSNPDTCRVYDPCLWIDPKGRLWLFVAQSYTYYDGRMGVWAMMSENYESEEPTFSAPRRIANGIMMNKPVVVGNDWLLPCAIWDKFKTTYNSLPGERYSNVYRSRDEGQSFQLISHTDYPDRFVDEHMIAQLSDGRLMMLIRGKHGIGQAFSDDLGESWSMTEDSGLGGPCSRFCIRRLKSGRLLLVNHWNFKRRDHLTAMISEDDAVTWKGYLLLDERTDVSYPDVAESENGYLYIIYDYQRYGARQIIMAKITEEDILSGKLVSEDSGLKIVLNKASGQSELKE